MPVGYIPKLYLISLWFQNNCPTHPDSLALLQSMPQYTSTCYSSTAINTAGCPPLVWIAIFWLLTFKYSFRYDFDKLKIKVSLSKVLKMWPAEESVYHSTTTMNCYYATIVFLLQVHFCENNHDWLQLNVSSYWLVVSDHRTGPSTSQHELLNNMPQMCTCVTSDV